MHKLFLKRLFGCSTANFGPLSRGQSYWTNINNCVFVIFLPGGHQELLSEVGSLGLVDHPDGFEQAILNIEHLEHRTSKIKTFGSWFGRITITYIVKTKNIAIKTPSNIITII